MFPFCFVFRLQDVQISTKMHSFPPSLSISSTLFRLRHDRENRQTTIYTQRTHILHSWVNLSKQRFTNINKRKPKKALCVYKGITNKNRIEPTKPREKPATLVLTNKKAEMLKMRNVEENVILLIKQLSSITNTFEFTFILCENIISKLLQTFKLQCISHTLADNKQTSFDVVSV